MATFDDKPGNRLLLVLIRKGEKIERAELQRPGIILCCMIFPIQ
jgi:hypothetical protein